eukprot:CAMPEP_0172533794 /NCGR_PEP_ID=MMETSP1067-20121228/6377_1 /TAXON_ID=265564 ORGANISM="Thalassiosira punctigera, Strain Tpunct2005C2" /NCGR_SAMPLE_ID=MMETSP1067 /ASSEMBLY_ACC=CAM_ASM_000444 /LENGTH=283 /DNA_ID=CAMNT_0013318489 /DNA_START=8 /DNA_END=856 /DNA_ORIENTATION=+
MTLSACLMLLSCFHGRPVSAFAPAPVPAPVAAPRRTSSSKYGHMIKAPVTSKFTSTSLPTTEETSVELLRILQQKAANSESDVRLDDQINSLVRTLVASEQCFDPAKSIDGPFFASVHFIGDTPLWEKIGGAGGVRNVKGQKYSLRGGTSSGTFVNYAEIFGKNFYLKAEGDCKDEGPVSPPSLSGIFDKKTSWNNPLEAFTSLFALGNRDNNQQSALLPTPYDYSAAVTGASIVLFQRFSLDLSIEGTGTVRVLYADDKLRIFLSPTDTKVTRGGGDWESEG